MTWVCLALGLLQTAGGAGEAPILIKDARLVVVSGPDVEGGSILLRKGLIEAVGKDLKPPFDARVIDGSRSWILPGFVEAHGFRGLDRRNEKMPSVPFVSVFDAINPVDRAFEDALRQGIATLGVHPGNDALVGGQACVVHPRGVTAEEMVVVRDFALKISLKPRPGMSRMAHLAALRRTLAEAKDSKDAKLEPLARALRGNLPVFVYCPTAADVHRAWELADVYGFKPTLVLGRDGWKAAEELARRKADVILDPVIEYWETDEERHEELLREGVLPLVRDGIRFAYQTDGSLYGTSQMWYQAATAARQGVPRATALKAATLWPAEMLGLGARLGSLDAGKDATIVVLTGDPLDARTWVDLVVVDGRIVYERSKDERLKKLLDGGLR
jgi:imidazolonepropionase-like amidohydrolase